MREDKSTKATSYHIFTDRWGDAIIYDSNPACIPGVSPVLPDVAAAARRLRPRFSLCRTRCPATLYAGLAATVEALQAVSKLD